MKSEDKNKDKDLNKSKESEQEQKAKRVAEKQDHPLKNHGVPENPEERRNAGLGGADNFKRNMGCGG